MHVVDWHYHSGLCHKLVSERQSWEESASNCQYMSSHLTQVVSDQHMTWLWQFVNKQRFWIGTCHVTS